MTPETIARALGGRRSGRGFSARCPLHGDRHPSLSLWIDDKGRLAVFCHAGCRWPDLVRYLKHRGLWEEHAVAEPGRDRAYRRDRMAEARQIWEESVALEYTPGAHYLKHWRAIRTDPGPRLRWHWKRFALVGLVTDPVSDAKVGVHVTQLDKTTNRKNGHPLLLGGSGVIRLIEGSGLVVIGEGIETTLSAAHFLPFAGGAWCALSANGIARLRLPYLISDIGLLVDRDPAGEAACRKGAEALHTARPSRRIRLLRPPGDHADFNDALRAMAGGNP
jgi:putative DNA primase/helicase